MFAPPPSPEHSPRTAPVEPCLTSYRAGAVGVDPFTTADPIMAAMGAYFAKREARRKAELAELKARARRILEERNS